MNIRKDIKVEGKHGLPFLMDIYYNDEKRPKPVVLFVHGFKGFKDWGHWHWVAKAFAMAGYYFVKFNFSHNGTTLGQPMDFADLEAFGQNNYSKEKSDLEAVLEYLHHLRSPHADLGRLCLLGHSRGGGLAITQAAQDSRVHRLITWAAVGDLGFASRHPEALAAWEKEGVYHVLNGRTGQQMPLYYQLHEDILAHAQQFDVEAAAQSMSKPWLIAHGTADPAVDVATAQRLKELCPSAYLEILTGADHVFGGRHPYDDKELPVDTSHLLGKCMLFLNKFEKK